MQCRQFAAHGLTAPFAKQCRPQRGQRDQPRAQAATPMAANHPIATNMPDVLLSWAPRVTPGRKVRKRPTHHRLRRRMAMKPASSASWGGRLAVDGMPAVLLTKMVTCRASRWPRLSAEHLLTCHREPRTPAVGWQALPSDERHSALGLDRGSRPVLAVACGSLGTWSAGRSRGRDNDGRAALSRMRAFA